MLEHEPTEGATTREPGTPERGKAAENLASASVARPPVKPGPHVRVIQGWFLRSAAVLAEVGIAFFLRELVAHRQPDFAPFITFYPAVLLASLLDGVWAGIAVTVLATLVAQIWIFGPLGQLAVSDPYDVLSLGIFFTFGVSLSIVVELYHRNREKLATYLVEEAIAHEREKQEAEGRLTESVKAERQRLLDVMEALPVMVSLRRPDRNISFANRAFREKFGDPSGRHCYEVRFGRSSACEDCDVFLPLETGEPHHREVGLPDNTLIEAHDFPFTDLDGTSQILEMGIDITARRRAETELKRYREHLEELVAERTRQLEAANAQLGAEIRQQEVARQELSESRAKLEAALSSMTDSVLIVDTEGRFVQFNDAYLTLYRFKSRAECAQNFSEFMDNFELCTESGEPLKRADFPTWRALRGESGSNVEYRYKRKDTGESWIGSLSFSPVRGEDGTISGAVITARDVTDRKRAEEALRSEKMALALAERTRQAREAERTRVSRDVHDQIGQILTAIKFDLTWMKRHLPKANEELRERLQGTLEQVSEGMRSVHKICNGLRPGVLDDLGLAAAIEWEANEFASKTGIDCAISIPAVDVPLDRDQATEIFRIFQECLTNITRHAEATTVRVSLHEEAGDLALEVADDGKGFYESEMTESLGLLGMKERAQVCGGTLEIDSSPGSGTVVTLRVPIRTTQLSETDYAHSDHR